MTSDNLIDSAAGVAAEGAAAAAIAGTGRRRRSIFSKNRTAGECLNCGTALRGRICHSCGQDSDDFQRPVWNLVLEVLDGLFSFDGRFWRTIPPLLVRPGHITRQYLIGVRARYVQPFRLLIAASVIFFLVFFLTSGGYSDIFNAGQPGTLTPEETAEAIAELDQTAADNPEAAAGIAVAREMLLRAQQDMTNTENDPNVRALNVAERRERRKTQVRQYLLPEDYPGVEAPEPGEHLQIGDESGMQMSMDVAGFRGLPLPARRFIVARAERIIDNPSSWTDAMQRWTPRLIFLLLPVYALLLALIHFWRRGLYLYDHLVVSLHFHAFLFLFLTLLILTTPLIGGLAGTLIFLVWSNVYLYRMHRVVYENGRFMAILRTLILDVAYLVVLMIALILLMLLGLVSA